MCMPQEVIPNAIGENNSPSVLVFSGGGVLGFAFAGALLALKETWGWDFGLRKPLLSTVAGVSAGAFLALLIVLGCSVVECLHIVQSLDLTHICSPNPATLLNVCGLDDGSSLRAVLADLVLKRVGTPDPTFAQLHALTGTKLLVGAVDVERCSVVYLGTETDPNVSVLSAVMASMALPPLFAPVRLRDGRLLADGGLLDNFPIHLFPASSVLGFRLTCTNFGEDISSTMGYLTRIARILSVPLDEIQWACLPIAQKSRTIIINIAGVSSTDMTLDKAAREHIVSVGRRCAHLTLNNWRTQKGVPSSSSTAGWLHGLAPSIRRWFTPLLIKY